jgi:hypothetical protein
MSTLEVPVQSLSTFDGDLRIGNDHFAITLHEVPPALATMLRELLEARVPTTAHVSISRDGVVALVGVEGSSQVRA